MRVFEGQREGHPGEMQWRLRDARTEVGEGALSQVVLRFAGQVDILDLTPCWKERCWGWGQWLVE